MKVLETGRAGDVRWTKYVVLVGGGTMNGPAIPHLYARLERDGGFSNAHVVAIRASIPQTPIFHNPWASCRRDANALVLAFKLPMRDNADYRACGEFLDELERVQVPA